MRLRSSCRRACGAIPTPARCTSRPLLLTAAFWQSESRAWTLSVARQPPDWVRGADAAEWVAVGMRFYEPRPRTVRAARVRPVVTVISGDSARRIRVLAPGARTVELMADFTEWSPVTLAAERDAFEGTFALVTGDASPRGAHRRRCVAASREHARRG